MNKKEIIAKVDKSLTIGQELIGVNENHREVISQYFLNGFNKRAAVHSVNPELSNNSANVTANYIFNHPENKAYIQEKQRELQEITKIEHVNILRELINWSYNDATRFMCLSAEEVQQLPDDLKRCIQDFKVKKRTYYDKQLKEEVTEESIELKFISKKDSMEMVNRHLGFYSEDNRQKGSSVNVLQILKESSPETLNTLLATITSNSKEDNQ